jgi:hypothetical protein
VYKELDLVSSLHGSVTEQKFDKIFEAMKKAEGGAANQYKEEEYEAIKIRVKVKAMDYLGRESTKTMEMELSDPDESESAGIKEHKEDILETTAAYLKVINVPCMYDLGTPTVDPYDHQLLLNIMDDLTYYKAIKPDFLDKKGRRAMHKIEKFK